MPVESGSKILKDALSEAMRDWITNVEDTFYIIARAAGARPYPMMVRDFQSVIGNECLTQMLEIVGRKPAYVIACISGGSNTMGIFSSYINHYDVALVRALATSKGLASGKRSASLTLASPSVLHGNRTYLLQNIHGQIIETHSISAGLDYLGVDPEHTWLKDSGHVTYEIVINSEALATFHTSCLIEGIIPAPKSSHALAYATKLPASLPKDKIILVNLSGHGDKK